MHSWRDSFSYISLENGADLYFDGSVTFLSQSAAEASAAVADSGNHIVHISSSGGSSCTCRRRFCAHQAAVMFAFEYSRKTEKQSTDQLMPDPALLIEEDLDPLRYYEEILVPLYRQLHRTDPDQILQTVNRVTDHLIRHPPADASLRRILQDTAVFLEELDLWANEKTREQRLLVYAESCSDQ